MNEPLWIPGEYQRADTRMWEFQQHVDVKGSYDQLHAFSVREKELFWSKLWDFCDVIGERGDQILNNHDRMQGAEWFPEAKLNFAENLLRFNDDRIALVSCLENGSRRSTDRVVRTGNFKSNTLLRQLVDIGGLNCAVAITTHFKRSELIAKADDNIRLIGSGHG